MGEPPAKPNAFVRPAAWAVGSAPLHPTDEVLETAPAGRTEPTGLVSLGVYVPRRESVDDNAAIAHVGVMATLNIRRLPEDVHAKLRVRAAKAGRSMEAEARMILAEAVQEKPAKPVDLASLRAFMLRLYGGELPSRVVDDFIEERRREARRELEE
ncbi:MAG: FitA-like ribbon-helix-helix domain-containing protein [Geminicoccaceae bacterium]